jgi:hypothetical protein
MLTHIYYLQNAILQKMKSVVLCGSRRFKTQIISFVAGLTKSGITVYTPYLHEGKTEWEKLSPQYKEFLILGLTHDHFYKIKMADAVYVYNPEGYAGVSTTMEIAYAVAMGKPIYAFSDADPELCRKVLFRGFFTTPHQLLRILK